MLENLKKMFMNPVTTVIEKSETEDIKKSKGIFINIIYGK